ncbi:transmembrane protein 179B [Tachysurus fulvidraco]|uniref:transmembrane protein 179B n=1 Tax=Tachysurus fulvidraco TaxID=1234273 RepID=UPI000F506CA0|nr:transmembrane protein 179B [Tachysurus fulvidraco]
MALPRLLLLLELAFYACCFICGIITAASVTLSQGDFSGKCLLYGSVRLNASEIDVSWSSASSLCYFVSGISVCVAVFCFSTTLYWVYSCCVDGEVKRERIWMTSLLLVSAVFLFFLLVTGCILKVGRDKFCESVIKTVPNISRCDAAQSQKWKSPLIGSSFYIKLLNAETAVWVNFFSWIIVVVLVVVQRRWGSDYNTRIEDPGASPSETEPFFKRPEHPN